MSEKSTVKNIKVSSATIRKARKRRLALKRRIVKGTLVAITATLVGLGIYAGSKIIGKNTTDNSTTTTINPTDVSYNLEISTDEILEVTLVNDGYDEEKFDTVVNELQSTGLKCSGIGINDFDRDDTNSQFFIAITPYGGDYTKVITTYNPSSASDQLAVAMSVATGHDATDIQRGITDLEKGNGSFKQSKLEELIGNSLVSNITVAYPEGSDINSDEILEASARVTDYLKNGGSTFDSMLYRVKPGDSSYTLGSSICALNNIDDTSVLDENKVLLLEPLSSSFSKDACINIEKVNNKNHSL